MDPATLAASAVGFLASKMVQLAGKGFEDAASKRLYDLISAQIRRTDAGKRVFDLFVGDPASVPRQSQLVGAVASHVNEDEEFAAALRHAVEMVDIQSESSKSEKNTVRFAGKMTRSAITQGENIDQSKRSYSLGGIPLALAVAVALLVIGGGTYGAVQAFGSNYPELDGTWRPPAKQEVLHFSNGKYSIDKTSTSTELTHTTHCEGIVESMGGNVYKLSQKSGNRNCTPEQNPILSGDGHSLLFRHNLTFIKDG